VLVNTEAVGRFPREPDLFNLDEHLVRCQSQSGGYEETPPTCLPVRSISRILCRMAWREILITSSVLARSCRRCSHR